MIGVIQIDGGERLAALPRGFQRSKPTSARDLARTLAKESAPVLVFWHINPDKALPLLRGIRTTEIWGRLHGIVFFRGEQYAGLHTDTEVRKWRDNAGDLEPQKLHVLPFPVKPGTSNPAVDFFVARFLDAVERQEPGDVPPFQLLEPPAENLTLIAAYLTWIGCKRGVLAAEQSRTACEWTEVEKVALKRKFSLPIRLADGATEKAYPLYSVADWQARLVNNHDYRFCCGRVCERLDDCNSGSRHLRPYLSLLKEEMASDSFTVGESSRFKQVLNELHILTGAVRQFLDSRDGLYRSWEEKLSTLPLSREAIALLAGSLKIEMVLDCPAQRQADELAKVLCRFVETVKPFLVASENSIKWQTEIDILVAAVADLANQIPTCNRLLK